MTSSDGVPPKLAILGFRKVLPAPVRPVGGTGQTGLPRVLRVLIVLTIVRAFQRIRVCLAQFCVNNFMIINTIYKLNAYPSLKTPK